MIVIGLLAEIYEFTQSWGSIITSLAWNLLSFNFWVFGATLITTFVPILYSIMFLITGKTTLKTFIKPFLFLDILVIFVSLIVIGFQFAAGNVEEGNERVWALLIFLATDGILSLGLYAVFQTEDAPDALEKYMIVSGQDGQLYKVLATPVEAVEMPGAMLNADYDDALAKPIMAGGNMV